MARVDRAADDDRVDVGGHDGAGVLAHVQQPHVVAGGGERVAHRLGDVARVALDGGVGDEDA